MRRIVSLAVVLAASGCSSAGSVGPSGPGGTEPPGAGSGAFAPQPVVPFDGGPTDVPFTLVPLTADIGDAGPTPVGFRLGVPFSIGGSPAITATLDTGSAGLQVVASALPAQAMASIAFGSGSEVAEVFESGIQLFGRIGTAPVTLGDRTTPFPIPILVADRFSCESGAACQTLTTPLENAVFQTFPAVLGVSFRSGKTAVGSPIPQLPGQPSFIIKAPNFGGASGTLRIGPSSDEVAAFQTLALGPETLGGPLLNGTPSWDDSAFPTCIHDGATGSDDCFGAIADTGTADTVIFRSGLTTQTVLQPGSDVTVTIGPTTAPIEKFDVVLGSTLQSGLDLFFVTAPPPGAASFINLGMTVFFRYDVYFDPVGGRIGFLPH